MTTEQAYSVRVVKREDIEACATDLLSEAGLRESLYVPPRALFAALRFRFVPEAPPACRGVALIAQGIVRVSHARIARRQDEEYAHEGGHLVAVLGGELEPHDEQLVVRPAGLALRVPRSSILRSLREERLDPRALCSRFPRMSKLDVLWRAALTGEFDVFVRQGNHFWVLASEQPSLSAEMEIHQLMDASQERERLLRDERGAVAVEMRVRGRAAIVSVVPRE